MGILVIYIFSMISLASAVSADAEYITIYPGEEGSVKIKVENNENYDIEDVSISVVPSTISSTGQIVSLPFTVIGGSQKDLDDLDEGDDDSATFRIKASTDIVPGDYNIPYIIYYKIYGENEQLQEEGSFGLRVSAKTELDFSSETNENPIVGQQGKISLEIINKGLGEVKSVSVQIFPQGFELLSSDKVFIGSISADDTDLASYDVVYQSTSPVLSAKIDYKDFDNNDRTETVKIPLKVYTQEQALNLGLIAKSSTGFYIGIVITLLVIWLIYRNIRKRRKNKAKEQVRR